ncbi:MAG: pitrilysin family protein [Cyanobacteriota/Melainabacteria group bacterium]
MVNSIKSENVNLADLGIVQGEEIKNVCEYTMENGLKVVLCENRTAPVVTFLVLYKVGSRNEGVGYTGATHFLEHMLFKGTKKHNADKGNGIDDLLTQIGAYWNATTWFDRTSYFEIVPREFFDLCTELEADRMRNLMLRQSDRDSEMSVVRNELERGENYPEEALEKELYAVAFREHPYHHPTIGWRSDVEGVPLDRLRKFYDTYYWPNNSTVVVLGDFKKEDALATIQKHFGKIKSSPEPIPQVYTTEPAQEGERRFEICRAGDLPRVWMGFHVPEASHEHNYTLAAIRHILGSTYERSTRLYKALIETGLAVDVFCRHDELRDPGLFIIGASLNPGVKMKKVEDAILSEIEKLATDSVTDAELNRVKSANRKGTILAMADPSSLAFLLGEAESKADWKWLMRYDDRFEEISREDVKEVTATYFTRTNRTVGYFKPMQMFLDEVREKENGNGKASIESDADLDVMEEEDEENLADIAVKDPVPVEVERQVGAFEIEKEELERLLAEAPKAKKVRFSKDGAGEKSFEERVRVKSLANGMKVLLMQNPGTGSVGIALNIKAGNYFTKDLPSHQAELMGELLSRGSEGFDKVHIAEALENMGIPSGLEFSVDNYRLGLATYVVQEDFNEYLDLLNDALRRPLLAESELDKLKVELSSKIIEGANNTRSAAWNGMKRSLYKADHPFYEKLPSEQIEELLAVKSADLHAVHQKLLSPASTILSIVGDIDLDGAFAEIEKRFSDWTGGEASPVVIPETALLGKRRFFDINVPDKSSADIILSHPTTLRRTDKDFYSARIANAALGQDTITSRLGTVVRDRAGLTYGIYSMYSDTAFGGSPWSVLLTVNPSNIEKALRLVDEVLGDYISRGISPQELSKETGRAVGSFKVGLSSSMGIARVLAELEFLGLGVKELDMLANRYLSVTKKSADAAMQKHFHPESFTTVIAGSLS